mmetsp:Transcript_81017/g.99253  ORF Transcript_81017/g.99253 Transcript_81017/m.99253 type:complete len:109 (+) Transcript_81017:140-466(+)
MIKSICVRLWLAIESDAEKNQRNAGRPSPSYFEHDWDKQANAQKCHHCQQGCPEEFCESTKAWIRRTFTRLLAFQDSEARCLQEEPARCTLWSTGPSVRQRVRGGAIV